MTLPTTSGSNSTTTSGPLPQEELVFTTPIITPRVVEPPPPSSKPLNDSPYHDHRLPSPVPSSGGWQQVPSPLDPMWAPHLITSIPPALKVSDLVVVAVVMATS